jgi:hypoxanthine phosphoribosyltransferase
MTPQLFSAEQIEARLQDLAGQINADYAGRTVDIVYMLNGASIFTADLARHLTVPIRLHALGFSSYPAPNASGEVRLTLDVTEPLHSRDVLLVEGIIVSGRTPKYITDIFRLRQPASLALCALGVKPKALAVDLPVAYHAFSFGSEVVVGYGVGEGGEKALPYLAARPKDGR